MENTTITIKIELTPRQWQILQQWDNMTGWLTMKCEEEVYGKLRAMTTPASPEAHS